MNDIAQNNEDFLQNSLQQISKCRFCIHISTDPECTTPIYCIKYSGSNHPIYINANTCYSCGEYKKS